MMTPFRAATLTLVLGCVWMMLALLGCAAHAAVTPEPAPAPLQVIVFGEDAPADLRLCVPLAAIVERPLTCLTVGELRQMLRGRRFAMR